MSVVVFPQYLDPQQGLSLEEFKTGLKALLAQRVQSAWLYGSVARGDAGPGRD